jgi:hypothetical protein
MSQPPQLTVDDFRPRMGTTLPVQTLSGPVPLKLTQVQELPASGRSGGAFRLEFHGPLQPFLVQASYVFEIGKSRCPIFIVPLGPAGPAMRYEAIFY